MLTISHENYPILPEKTFFQIFVHLTPKHTIIVKITFLGEILHFLPLYGWCLPLKTGEPNSLYILIGQKRRKL